VNDDPMTPPPKPPPAKGGGTGLGAPARESAICRPASLSKLDNVTPNSRTPRGNGNSGRRRSKQISSMVARDAIGSGHERARVIRRKSAYLTLTVTVRAALPPRS